MVVRSSASALTRSALASAIHLPISSGSPPGFERGSVADHLGLDPSDLRLGDVGLRVVLDVHLIHVHLVDRLGDTMRRERLAQPAVDAPQDGVFAQVDVARVIKLVTQGVLARERAASGSREPRSPPAPHLPLVDAADHDALEGIGVARTMRRVLAGAAPPPGEHVLHVSERLVIHKLWMDDLFGKDPFFGVVPPELCCVAECDVLDVQQHLIPSRT